MVLQHMVIVTRGGSMLFHHSFMPLVAKPRLTASLLAALVETTLQRTGKAVSYVECGSFGISICCEVEAGTGGLVCSVFHDHEDGEMFGNVLAMHTMSEFKSTFKGLYSPVPLNTSIFACFHTAVSQIIRGCVRHFVCQIAAHDCVEICGLVCNDAVYHLVDKRSTAKVPVDEMQFVAHLHSLLDYASDMMALTGDACDTIILDNTFVERIQNSEAVLMAKLQDRGRAVDLFRRVTKDTRKLLTTALSYESSISLPGSQFR